LANIIIYWWWLILFPLIRALHAPKKLRHRFVRAPRLHHQKVRHIVRTFRTTTSRRVDVFPRLVASEHVVDALFIRDGNVRFRPVFVSYVSVKRETEGLGLLKTEKRFDLKKKKKRCAPSSSLSRAVFRARAKNEKEERR